MRLAFRCVVRNGIRRFQVADPSNDPARLRRIARDRAGGRRRGGRDRAHLLDQPGAHACVLRRARGSARGLRRDGPALPEGPGRPADPGRGARAGAALRRAPPASGRSSCTATARSGSRRSSTWRACGPGSTCCTPRSRRSPAARRTRPPRRRSATSRPRASRTGSTSRRSPRCREHFRGLGRERGLPSAQPQEFDATYYHHQLAGGMVSTTRRMLEELRRPELFDAVLEEVGRVRAEMGYPIIVTPVSQLVATQAVRNVIDGERWSNVSDETVRYFLGHYGEPAAPVDPDVAERVLSRPRAEELRDLEPLHLEGARERFGTRISDEELLLRLTMPEEQVDAMRAWAARGDAAPGRPRRARARSRRCCGRSRSASRSRTCACRRATSSWSGAVRLDDVKAFVLDVDGTLVHRAGDEVHVQPGRARGAGEDPRLGPAARHLHERQPRVAGRVRRGPPRRRTRHRRRGDADAAPQRPVVPARRAAAKGRCCSSRPTRPASTSSQAACTSLDGTDDPRIDAVFVAHADPVDFARARARGTRGDRGRAAPDRRATRPRTPAPTARSSAAAR